LREGYCKDGTVKSRTVANLLHWPLAKIERRRRVLRDEALSNPEEGLAMLRSLPHGHVAAALGTARRIGLDQLLAAGTRAHGQSGAGDDPGPGCSTARPRSWRWHGSWIARPPPFRLTLSPKGWVL
jgi:hypothetical protein